MRKKKKTAATVRKPIRHSSKTHYLHPEGEISPPAIIIHIYINICVCVCACVCVCTGRWTIASLPNVYFLLRVKRTYMYFVAVRLSGRRRRRRPRPGRGRRATERANSPLAGGRRALRDRDVGGI